MPAPRPFPTTLIRDLQGLVRLLYRLEQSYDMPDESGRLARLEEAGRALGDALELAGKARGKVPVSAWGWTDKGVALLRELVQGQPELRELVRVATLGLERRREPPKAL